MRHGYIGRKHKKREFRSLWIVRINAACRTAGISYSKFMDGLKKAGIDLNRKVLAEIAATDEAGFRALVERAQASAAPRRCSRRPSVIQVQSSMAATPSTTRIEDADALQSLEERIVRAVDLVVAIAAGERRCRESELKN